MADLILDSRSVGKGINVTVQLTHGREVRLRMYVMLFLLKLAAYIAPISLILWRDEGEPWFQYCERCGLGFATRRGTGKVKCHHCGFWQEPTEYVEEEEQRDGPDPLHPLR